MTINPKKSDTVVMTAEVVRLEKRAIPSINRNEAVSPGTANLEIVP